MKKLWCAWMILLCCLTPTAEAKRAPNLEFKNLAGQTRKIADLRGSITVINFWATWCGPCVEEMPLLSKIGQEYADRKVRFIAISADQDADSSKTRVKIDQFLSVHKTSLEVWLGGDLDMLDRLNLGNVLPATVIVDQQGEVIARVMGEAHEEDIKTPLDWLLNGRSGAAPAPVTKRY